MSTKNLRSLFNVFTSIIDTNPTLLAEHYLYCIDVPCPDWAEDVYTMPAELADGSLGLAVETVVDIDGELESGPRFILRPDYETGRMVRA